MTVGEKGEVEALTKKVGVGEKEETGRQRVWDRREKGKTEALRQKGKSRGRDFGLAGKKGR